MLDIICANGSRTNMQGNNSPLKTFTETNVLNHIEEGTVYDCIRK